jgi:GntR family transcriptional regulator / MocR family aminotransferase
VIVEDDYDSEFRYSDRPLDPLQSIDRGGRVIYVGSFSKTLLPMLRLGFLVAPASLQPALRKAKQLTDWHTETPIQAALARFVAEGLLGRHVRKATREYAARRAQIVSGLSHYLGSWLEVVPSMAGLHVCARLVRPAALESVVARAAAAGVVVEPLSAYCMGEPQAGLVIGYGSIASDRIERGLRRLARCF